MPISSVRYIIKPVNKIEPVVAPYTVQYIPNDENTIDNMLEYIKMIATNAQGHLLFNRSICFRSNPKSKSKSSTSSKSLRSKKMNFKYILDLSNIPPNSDLRQIIIDKFIIAYYNYKNYTNIDGILNVFLETKKPISHYGTIALTALDCMRIIDSPPNVMNTESIVDYILNNPVPGLNIEVIGEAELKKNNYQGILAVNQACPRPPKMLILRYSSGGNESNPIVLVGKGVIFDSGGINIKFGEFSDMKHDKTGAIYVWGLLKSLAIAKSQGNFIGILPFVENMPGSNAVHPGDIISTCRNKTVEVANTDAEGRLILADALCWITNNRIKPSIIIDIATLTGQAASIFGELGTAVMTNAMGAKYVNDLQQIGEKWREYFWILPLHRVFRKYLQSNVADITNSPSIRAGTIMAGMFLAEFVDNDVPWIHLDIAGVAFKKRATGTPLCSIYYFIQHLVKSGL
jgi:leucyl aminopeptidase